MSRAERKLREGIDAPAAAKLVTDLRRQSSRWRLSWLAGDEFPSLRTEIDLAQAHALNVIPRLQSLPATDAERGRALDSLRTPTQRVSAHLTLDETPVLLALTSTRHLPQALQETIAVLRTHVDADAAVLTVPRWAAHQLLIELGQAQGFNRIVQIVETAQRTSEEIDAAAARWLAARHETTDPDSDLHSVLHSVLHAGPHSVLPDSTRHRSTAPCAG